MCSFLINASPFQIILVSLCDFHCLSCLLIRTLHPIHDLSSLFLPSEHHTVGWGSGCCYRWTRRCNMYTPDTSAVSMMCCSVETKAEDRREASPREELIHHRQKKPKITQLLQPQTPTCHVYDDSGGNWQSTYRPRRAYRCKWCSTLCPLFKIFTQTIWFSSATPCHTRIVLDLMVKCMKIHIISLIQDNNNSNHMVSPSPASFRPPSAHLAPFIPVSESEGNLICHKLHLAFFRHINQEKINLSQTCFPWTLERSQHKHRMWHLWLNSVVYQ